MTTGLFPVAARTEPHPPAVGFPGRFLRAAHGPRSEGGHGTIRIATGSQPIIFPCR